MSSTPADPASPVSPPAFRRKAVLATGVGNFMEWFDFAVYGFVATTIGQVFFPTDDPTVSLLSALAVFGVAFFFRPVGGFVFGWVGDRFGRRPALATSIILMGVSTTLIALLPSYETVGIVAPVLLVLLRCVQGVSAGGEWTGSSTFLIEQAPQDKRGLASSVISMTAALAGAVGGLVGLTLSLTLSDDAMLAWGWRIPFLVAAPLTAIGLYLRIRLDETPVYRNLQRQQRVTTTPLRRAGKENLQQIGLVFAAASVIGLGYYYLVTFAVSYLTETSGFDPTTALVLTSVGLLVYAALCPCVGMLSDRIGRRPTMIGGCAAMALFGVPAFGLMSQGVIVLALLGLVLLGIAEALANVTSVVLLAELFPDATRVSGASVGYNLALAIVAGPGPFLGGWLVASTGLSISPAFYLCGVALLAGVALWRYLPETRESTLSAVAEEPVGVTRPQPMAP
ncbi:MAG: MFS transporter [Actinomycetes bacterium]